MILYFVFYFNMKLVLIFKKFFKLKKYFILFIIVGLELFLIVKFWIDLEVFNVGIGVSRFVILIFLILRKRLDNLFN